RPAGLAVFGHSQQRAHETTVRVGRARPDMALVEMRVEVREARQHQAAVEIANRSAGGGSGRPDGGDSAGFDLHVVATDRAVAAPPKGGRWDARIAEGKGVGLHYRTPLPSSPT